MNKVQNPFVPGAGITPPEIAGRDSVLEGVKISCLRALQGRVPRSFMLTGLRGVGKTVLLTQIDSEAQRIGCIVSKVESPENNTLADLLYPLMKIALLKLSKAELAKDVVAKGLRALRNFAKSFKLKIDEVEITLETEPGVADSGNLEFDVPDMFELIGNAAKAQKKAWILLIDEVQYLKQDELAAILVAMHKMAQKGLPVVFVGAGLPQVARLAGEAKSYSERLFEWCKIGPLTPISVEIAVRNPVEEGGAKISQEALDKISEITQGYPFFIQTLAYYAWNEAQPSSITVEDVKNAYRPSVDYLSTGLFDVRYDRLNETEIEFVRAMASLDNPPYSAKNVKARFSRSVGVYSKIRDNLIKKGTIYSPRYGFLDFTVPLFAEYLNGSLLNKLI